MLGASNSIPDGQVASKARLRIVVENAGSLAGIKTGHVFELGNETTIIGRDTRSDICLNDPGVSHRHLILNHTFGVPILENLSDDITPVLESSPLQPGDKRALDRGSDLFDAASESLVGVIGYLRIYRDRHIRDPASE